MSQAAINAHVKQKRNVVKTTEEIKLQTKSESLQGNLTCTHGNRENCL